MKKKSSQLLGIEFQGEGIALALSSSTKGHSEVQEVSYIPYAEGESVGSILKKWVSDHKCENAACNVVLDADQYQLLLVEPPEVPDEEMRDAIRWRLKDLISISPEKAAIDFFYLPADGTKAKKKMMYIVVAEADRIKSLVSIIEKAELRLHAVDIAEMSLRNVIGSLICGSDLTRGVALVRVLANAGSIYLYRNNDLYLARSFTLDYNGGLLDDLPIDALAIEMQRSIDYYERQMGQAPPIVIYICGEHVSEDKITTDLKDAFTVPVQHLDPKSIWFDAEHLDEDLMQRCVCALGGTLRNEMVV